MNSKVISYVLMRDDVELLREVINEKNKDLPTTLYDTTILQLACENNCIKCVDFLLKLGANPNLRHKDSTSPLLAASERGNYDIVKKLLTIRNINPNICNINGISPLYISSQNGCFDVVKLLLYSGANPNLCNDNGISPLMIASQNKHISIIHELLINGANPNLYNNEGYPILHTAVHYQYFNVVHELLRSGADPNILDKHGISPLHVASDHNDVYIALELLRSGADHTLLWGGKTPLDLALQKRNDDVISVLSLLNTMTKTDKVTRSYILQLALIRDCDDNLLSEEYLPHDMFVEICKKIKILLIEN